MKAGEDVVCAPTGLVLECTHPKLCCLSMESKKVSYLSTVQQIYSWFSSAKALMWCMFKQLKGNQGVEKLFSTQGCITEHINFAVSIDTDDQCHWTATECLLPPTSHAMSYR